VKNEKFFCKNIVRITKYISSIVTIINKFNKIFVVLTLNFWNGNSEKIGSSGSEKSNFKKIMF